VHLSVLEGLGEGALDKVCDTKQTIEYNGTIEQKIFLGDMHISKHPD